MSMEREYGFGEYGVNEGKKALLEQTIRHRSALWLLAPILPRQLSGVVRKLSETYDQAIEELTEMGKRGRVDGEDHGNGKTD